MSCSTAFLALDFAPSGHGLAELGTIARAIQEKPEELLGAKVGFEATVEDKLHATFVFCGELLHALPKAELAELHQELGALIQEAEIEELPFNRFELFPPGKQNLVIARFFAPKRLVRLRRQLWRSCLQRKAALKVDDEWLPHVTLGKLQASKAQVGQVDCRRLEALVPQKRLMVEGVTLLGLRPKQLWLDWDEAFRFRAPEKSGEEDKDEDSSKPGSSVSTGEPEVYQQWSASLVEPSNQPMGASNHLGS